MNALSFTSHVLAQIILTPKRQKHLLMEPRFSQSGETRVTYSQLITTLAFKRLLCNASHLPGRQGRPEQSEE